LAPPPAREVKRCWEWALVVARPPAFANPRFTYFETEQECRAAEREVDPSFVTTVVSGAKAALKISESQRISAMRAAIQQIAGSPTWARDARARLAAELDDEPVDLDDLEYEPTTNGHQVEELLTR
jgi:hypothetical protein